MEYQLGSTDPSNASELPVYDIGIELYSQPFTVNLIIQTFPLLGKSFVNIFFIHIIIGLTDFI